MLDISITLVVIAHVVVSLLLILVILMQRPKQEGLGAAFGSGMTDAAWGARTTDVLQKGTVYLGTMFFVFSLVLAILMGKRNSEGLGKAADEDGASTTTGTVENAGNPPAAPPAGILPPNPEGTEPPKPEGTEAPKPEGTEAPKPEGTEPPKPEGTEAPEPEEEPEQSDPAELPKPVEAEATGE
ncbi:MAG: preprotein translocase subunit SecG [Akkermansiaceae bacterium]